MSNIFRFIIIALLLALSFFFSSAESVYSTTNRLRLQKDIEEKKRNSRQVNAIVNDYENTVLTILLGNNFVNIALTALVTGMAITYDNTMGGTGQYVAIFTAVLFVTLVIIGEIIPKTIGVKFNYRLAYLYYYLYKFFYYLFTPILFVFRLFNKKRQAKKVEVVNNDGIYTEDELQLIVDEIEEHGLIDEETSDLVRSAIEFTETEAYEIMTPRVDVFSYDIDDDIKEVMKEQGIFKFSRIPVYEDTIDNIIGILSTKDLIKLTLSKKKINIRSLIKAPLFVHHTKNISQILTDFKKTKNHIAIVIDEYGGTEGIITMEDILEEIIGEIWDESDEVNEPIIKKAENHYLIDGGLNIEDFFELFELDEDEDNDYDTVAGWCLEMLDRFAKVGDTFRYENILVKITKIDGFVVDKIEVFVEDKE
ncbi:MAG: hemolysin family protein [Bacilli bacterium]|nr:hemolysin family protein [Bacilli bacterium]